MTEPTSDQLRVFRHSVARTELERRLQERVVAVRVLTSCGVTGDAQTAKLAALDGCIAELRESLTR